MSRLCLSIVFAVLVFALEANAVEAHAQLIDADPAPGSALSSAPATLRLTFTEAVDAGLSSLSLFSADGQSIPLGALAVLPDEPHVLTAVIPDPGALEAGIYTVVWGAYSAEDDHSLSGSFTFSVGTGVAPEQGTGGGEPVVAEAIAGKWLELLSAVLITGLGIFRSTTRETVSIRTMGRTGAFGALALIGLIGALISLRAREIAITGDRFFSGVDPDTISGLLGSTYGVAWLARVAALLGIWGLAAWGGRVARVGIAALGLFALATIALSGHAAAVNPSLLAISVDFLHMAGAGVWLGGLLGLLLLEDPRVGSEAYRQLLRSQGNRFAAAVVLILAAGAVSAWWHVGGRRGLTGSDYGQTLLIKLAFVAAVLGVALYNRRVLQGERPRLEWTPFAIGLELVLAGVVLLLSSDLSQTPPANRPLPVALAARAIELDAKATAGASMVELSGIQTGDPADLIFIDVSPPEEIQRLIVRTSLTDTETGVVIGDRFDAEPVNGEVGRFQFPAGRLGIAGDWQLEITVRRAGVVDNIARIPIDTSGLAPRGTTLVDDSWGGFRLTPHTALALALALLMLLVGLGGLKRITGLEPLASGFLLAASLLIAGGFLVSAARGVVPTTPEHGRANPMQPDPATLTYAGELYRLNCLACHGADGSGAGSTNLAHLHGNSADLTRPTTTEQSDGDLRFWIGHGVPGSEMPAFSPELTEEEQWLLVRYIRELQDAAKIAAQGEE